MPVPGTPINSPTNNVTTQNNSISAPTSTPQQKWSLAEPDQLYNTSFIQSTLRFPVTVCDMRLAIVWKEKGTITKRINIYPSDTVVPVVQIQDPNNTNNVNAQKTDHIFDLIAANAAYDKYNFLRNVTCKRYTRVGGNTLEIQLLDPSGYIIDQALINGYLANMLAKNSSVHCEFSYGWAGDPEERRVSSSASWILYGMNVETEYTGASYTLKFVDMASNILNSKTSGWTLTPGLVEQSGTGSKDVTFLEALKLYWTALVQNNQDIESASNPKVSCILMVGTDNKNGALAEAAYTGDSIWKGGAQPLENWAPGDKTFLEWLQNNLSSAEKCEDKHYTSTFITADTGIKGNWKDYKYYNATTHSFDDITEDMHNNKRNSVGKDFWYLTDAGSATATSTSNSYTALMIMEDVLQTATDASDKDAGSGSTPTAKVTEGYIRKKYKYLTGGLDPHNTVLRLTVDSSALFGRYLMRARSEVFIDGESDDTAGGGKVEIVAGGPPDDVSKTTTIPATNAQAGSVGLTIEDKTKAISATESTASYQAAMSFVAISVTAEVVGDPDLGEALRNYVIIDFGDQSAATFPWIKGVYLCVYVNDTLTDGMWTSALHLIKMGPPPQNDQIITKDSTPPISTAISSFMSTAPPVPGAITRTNPVVITPEDTVWNGMMMSGHTQQSAVIVSANTAAAQTLKEAPMTNDHAQSGCNALIRYFNDTPDFNVSN
jgi:hypothetical protein